ncbi:MAG: leucyl/phenylalanyl-tRNA--protein transferase [Alphaproteobacteria bacterium]|nr:leucyl/phenylalanyl-tRNA--protein transferase [Alphaproteobacteria bacterium]MBP7759081.1 leucyl/phenylalanyl-tRNA--protein transferase [Alphaproteobacteria bacterium]MBP7762445.1 leucyl/phenylalanyl-tRNA--protein transferase [Alphaproteobacteria bacterium]MBP7904522.1 leucyl/phenylalanyl-tRNA--protein transferase [Alphaproteobacteria bacterium]
MQLVLTTELLLEAYKQGLFPMAQSAHSKYIHWVCPELRGQLPIADLKISRSLQKIVKRQTMRSVFYTIRINTAFEQVIDGCARKMPDRPETWINGQIREACVRMHREGHAHSVECWQGDELVGGLYGLAIGAAFFGESMFSIQPNASKVALVHLCARLWRGGFTLLDTQFVNNHLQQFGVYELRYEEYIKILREAAKTPADFLLPGTSEAELIARYFKMRDDEKIYGE